MGELSDLLVPKKLLGILASPWLLAMPTGVLASISFVIQKFVNCHRWGKNVPGELSLHMLLVEGLMSLVP